MSGGSMKKKSILLFLLCSIAITQAQDLNSDSTRSSVNPDTEASGKSKIFYGGNINFAFWNEYFYIGLYPMIGYKLTTGLAAGARIGYAYISDGRYNPTLKSDNYGAGVFARYNLFPSVYVKAEYLYFSMERAVNILSDNYDTERVGVPFLLMGAGYNHNVGNNISVFFEISFDVIQDDNSPFESGDPLFSIGMGVGI
jgi:hypothetical protein